MHSMRAIQARKQSLFDDGHLAGKKATYLETSTFLTAFAKSE